MNNWVIYNKKKNIKEIASKYNISYLTAIILCNRNLGLDDIKMVLSNDINDLNDEKNLPDIDKACKILLDYIKNSKNIRIVGDYDIDGVVATYILYDGLKKLGANVSYDIPNRVLDGYGINKTIIDRAIKDKIDLIITCDNGIAAKEQIQYAVDNGIECIVTDHHDIGELPTKASAIVNPKRNDIENKYGFKEISGGVVAWKVIMRLYDLYGTKKYNRDFVLDNYLEFAMISTIGDIMPLIDENHIIAKLGLKKIVNTKNKGLKKLLDVSELNYTEKEINSYHIGFIIGPLINACGRMEDATLALEIFTEDDDLILNDLALKIKKLNDERKQMTEKGINLAIELIEKKYLNDKILVVYVEGLLEQVAGIVAGRIKDKYNKPTIILTDTGNEDEAKASCRSIDAYDIFNALNNHKELFFKFGGHKLAAGFSISKDYIDKLRDILNNETTLTEKDFVKKVQIDVEYNMKDIDEKIITELNSLEPYGQGFKKPVFAEKKVNTKITNIYGAGKNVIKLEFEKDGFTSKGVIFCDSDEFTENLTKKSCIDVLYYPKINEFKGYKNVEIWVIDYR